MAIGKISRFEPVTFWAPLDALTKLCYALPIVPNNDYVSVSVRGLATGQLFQLRKIKCILGGHMQAKGHCCQVPAGWGTYSIAKSRLVEGPLLPGWVVCGTGTTIAKSWQDKEPLLPGPDKALQQISRNNSSVSGKTSRWVLRISLNCKNMVPVLVWEDTVYTGPCAQFLPSTSRQ